MLSPTSRDLFVFGGIGGIDPLEKIGNLLFHPGISFLVDLNDLIGLGREEELKVKVAGPPLMKGFKGHQGFLDLLSSFFRFFVHPVKALSMIDIKAFSKR